MKFNRTVIAAFAMVATVSGCATMGTDGVQQIGPDMYMVGGLGNFTDFSSSAVKGRMYKQAAQFCSEKNKVMVPVNSTGQDSGLGTYASAEIQFRCVKQSDPRAKE